MQSVQVIDTTPELSKAQALQEPQVTDVAPIGGTLVEQTAHHNFSLAAQRLGLSADQRLLLRTQNSARLPLPLSAFMAGGSKI